MHRLSPSADRDDGADESTPPVRRARRFVNAWNRSAGLSRCSPSIWAIIASVTTNGLIAFAMGGLDHAWLIVVITPIWLAEFLIACPKI